MSETTGDVAMVQHTTFQVQNFIDAKELKRDLRFTTNNLDEAMMEQASLFANYGVLLAQASHQVDVIKLLLEQTEAAVYKLLRDKAATDGEKVTEVQLEKLIARNARVISMKKALNEAKRIESTGKTATEAFRHKKDMLVQQGAVAREERKGELAIHARSAADDARQATRDAVLAQRLNRGGEVAA